MNLKGKVALFFWGRNTVDITDIATGEEVQQHDIEGKHGWGGASVQKNIAAMVFLMPYHGVHVMNIASGKVLCRFALPSGRDARVVLSKDTLTLAVGNSTGMP